MKKYYYKFIKILLTLSMCVQIGCYSLSRGDFTRYSEVPNTQVLLNYTYDYSIFSKPTIFSPVLVLKFTKKPSYQYEATEIYQEIKSPNKGANTVPNILIYGGVISSIGGGVMALDTSNSADKKKTGTILLGAGLASALLGAIFKVDENPKVTNNEIKGNTITKTRDGYSTALENNNINVKVDKMAKIYTTNSQGKINLDLVKDFNLVSFDEERDILVEYEIMTNDNDLLNVKTQSVKLKSSEWTSQYLLITADEAQIYDTPAGSGKKLGDCKKTEKYLVLDNNNSGWTKINFNGNSGWISTYAGNYIWLSN